MVVTAIYLLAPHLPERLGGSSLRWPALRSLLTSARQCNLGQLPYNIGGRHGFLSWVAHSLAVSVRHFSPGERPLRGPQISGNSVFLLSAAAIPIATISWLLFDPNEKGGAGRFAVEKAKALPPE